MGLWPRVSTSSDLNKGQTCNKSQLEIVGDGKALLRKEGQFGLDTPCE